MRLKDNLEKIPNNFSLTKYNKRLSNERNNK